VKRINCVCGIVVEGDDDDDLCDNAQQHLMADHPDLVGKVTRDDIVAQAEELASTVVVLSSRSRRRPASRYGASSIS
jgi:hypothetical protein